MQFGMQPDFFDVELEGRPARAYNEQAFRYFLSIERKRSERASRPFALLLISRRLGMVDAGRIGTDTATRLFVGLSLCLRETDFVGWYDEGLVAGAVLTHLGDLSGADVTHQVRRRIMTVAFTGLLPEFSEQFEMRIYQLPAQELELNEKRS